MNNNLHGVINMHQGQESLIREGYRSRLPGSTGATVRHNENKGSGWTTELIVSSWLESAISSTSARDQTGKQKEIKMDATEKRPMLRNRESSTTTSEMSLITHRGPWDAHSRQYKILRFLERYLDTLDEKKIKSTPCTTFFSPNAVFHDTKGDVYLSGSHIWAWMKRLFAPFDSVTHEIVEVRAIPETEERVVVYGEFVRHFKLKNDRTDIVSPMFCIVTIGPAEVSTFSISLEGELHSDTSLRT